MLQYILFFCLNGLLLAADPPSIRIVKQCRIAGDYPDFRGRVYSFYMGKKFCKYGTKNWDNACQDALMQHHFGKDWRTFKRLTLDFQKAARDKDWKALFKMCRLPLLFQPHCWPTLHTQEEFFKEIPDLLSGKFLKHTLHNAKYKEFIITGGKKYGSISIHYRGNFGIAFETPEDLQKPDDFIPKVYLIFN